MTGRELRAIVALADHLHFGRAAASLKMAQPHLSTLIQRLEVALCFLIVERKPRVRLTVEGEIIATAARRALQDIDAAVSLASQRASGRSGPLSVGFASTTLLTPLLELVRRFMIDYPKIELKLIDMHSAEHAAALLSARIDLAIGREIGLDDRFEGALLFEEPFVAVLPTNHPLAAHAELKVSQLSGERLILFPQQVAPTLYEQIAAMLQREGLCLRPAQTVKEWHNIMALVRNGFGASLAPDSVRALSGEGVVCIPLSNSQAVARLQLWWLRDRPSPAAARLIQHLLKG